MKYLLTALTAAFCAACLAVVSCSELDGNPHDEKSSNYAGGGDTASVIKQFAVAFYTNGGVPSTISPVTVDSGTTLVEKYPADPTKPGNTFGGWFDGAEQYAALTVITKDVMLIAKWDDTTSATVVRQFAVAFHTNGGTPAIITPVTVDSGAALAGKYPAGPTKPDNTFGGWFDGVELYTASTVITKDVTLVAKWDEDGKGGGGDGPAYYTLTVGAGTAGGGTVSRDPDLATYAAGTMVTVKATALAGYRFTGWTGASTSTNDEITLSMSDNVTLTANFHPISYHTIAVNIDPMGGGTVSRDPNQANYMAGTRVKLTAAPAAGYRFSGWSGALNETDSVLTVTVNSDLAFTANFEQVTYRLVTTVTPPGSGTVSRNPNQTNYPSGTAVTVTAVPADGYLFAGWSGALTSADVAVAVTINSNTTLTANFTPGFIDSRDDKIYRTVTIGGKTWMAENLDHTTVKSWCYDNAASNCVTYGRLYTWDAAMTACPPGWYLPTRQEWVNLVTAVGGNPSTKLKSKAPGWNGTDDFGFSAMPGGSGHPDGRFSGIGTDGYWWTATEDEASATGGSAWGRAMDSGNAVVGTANSGKDAGYSVRCVKQ